MCHMGWACLPKPLSQWNFIYTGKSLWPLRVFYSGMLSAVPGAALGLSCHMWPTLVIQNPKKDWKSEVKVTVHFLRGRHVVCVNSPNPQKACKAGISLDLQGRRWAQRPAQSHVADKALSLDWEPSLVDFEIQHLSTVPFRLLGSRGHHRQLPETTLSQMLPAPRKFSLLMGFMSQEVQAPWCITAL